MTYRRRCFTECNLTHYTSLPLEECTCRRGLDGQEKFYTYYTVDRILFWEEEQPAFLCLAHLCCTCAIFLTWTSTYSATCATATAPHHHTHLPHHTTTT